MNNLIPFLTKLLILILLVNLIEGQEEICEKNSVCGIVHNRFWLPNKHESFCKCSGKPCPVVFSQDGNFLPINTRSQMRFCEPLELKQCDSGNVSLSIEQRLLPNQKIEHEVRIHCKCSGHKYWKYFSHAEKHSEDTQVKVIVDTFQCIDLRRCSADQFCGFARSDYGFVYHRCTCPEHYKCIFDPGSPDLFDGVQELFYNGTAYEAHCKLMSEADLW
ncbi:U-scoloptoxin(11)-Sm6a [Sergentomyia squamirostris]